MEFDDTWRTLRRRAESLDPESVLVTPGSERVFAVDRTDEDGVAVQYWDDGERTLDRGQFAVLLDRVGEEGLEIDGLPPGVEPYVAVLSLSPAVALDESRNALVPADEGADGDDVAEPVAESPFVRSRWDVRRPPEEVHDDALLVAEFLERRDATDRSDLDGEALADLYVLLSDLQWGADDLRRDVGEDLLDHIGPEGRVRGRYGTVSRARREYRTLKDDDEILERLDEAGVPRDWVLGVDEEKLDVVLAATEVEEEDVYDVDARYHIQKTAVDSDEKRTRLQGLRDRLDDLDGEEADRLRDEIDTLEGRLEDLLAAG